MDATGYLLEGCALKAMVGPRPMVGCWIETECWVEIKGWIGTLIAGLGLRVGLNMGAILGAMIGSKLVVQQTD